MLISKGLDLGEKIAKAKREAEKRDKEKSENEAAEASKEAGVFFARKRAQSDPGSFSCLSCGRAADTVVCSVCVKVCMCVCRCQSSPAHTYQGYNL
jgi:hypothetical protein